MGIRKKKMIVLQFLIIMLLSIVMQFGFMLEAQAATYTITSNTLTVSMDDTGRYWLRLQPGNIQVFFGDGTTSNTYVKINNVVSFKNMTLKSFTKNGDVIEQTRTYDGVDVTLRLSIVNNGGYMKAELIFKNNNSSSRNIGGEFYWDMTVNGNDSSPFEFIENGWRNYYNGKQVTCFYKGTYHVVDASMVYAGTWGGSNPGWAYGRGYTYYVGQRVSTTDTAAAIWWDSVPVSPGQTRIVSTILGVGELNIPPTLTLTSPAPNTRYFNGESFHLTGVVNDQDVGDIIELKYAIDNNGETTLMTFTSNGSPQPFDFNLTIPDDLGPGNHELQVWTLDNKGGASTVARVPFVREDFNIPGAPTYSNVTTNSFTVNWDTNGNVPGTIYELFDVNENTTVYRGTGTSYDKSGLQPNTAYSFKTRAENKIGRQSNYSAVTTIYTLANKPLSKGYDNITDNSVRLLWNPNGNPPYTNYHYEVRRKSDNSLVAQGTVNGTSVTVTGLSGGHEQYRFFVRAINGDGVYTDFTELIIPNLVVYQKSNYAKAEWGIEMLEEDVLIDASFEDGETYIPSFQTRFPVFAEEGISFKDSQDNRYLQSTIRARGWITKQDFDSGNYTRATTFEFNEKYSTYYKMSDGRYRLEHNLYVNGQQEFTSEESYTGNKSYKIGRTLDKMGNNYYDLDTSANSSVGKFPHTTAIANGVDLSLTFRAKTDNKATISPRMYGGRASWTYPFHEIYGLPNPLVVTKAASVGEKKIYISGIEQLNPNGIYYVTRRQNRTEYNRDYDFTRILEINKNEGYIVLQSGITEDFPVGYVLHTHVKRTPVSFGGRTIYAKDGWQLFSINAKVADYPDYKSDLLGLGLWFIITSEGNTYIDDVKLGFATKAELYRDGNKVYEGFLSDYDDYEATDKTAPNPISSINVTNTGNIINITFDAPEDNGTTYNYQLKAVKHNGDVISSEVKSVTIISDIKGYSYVIDSNPNTVPDDIVDVTTPEINATINPNIKNYVHIKVIDNEGNASEVFHQEIGIPVLTATPNHEEDYIHLDWQMNDTSKDYAYMIYKKMEGEDEFQTIPAKDRITNETSWDDHTGQDVHGPTKPIITEVKFANNGNTINIKYTPSEDIGTKYYYYVEGTAKNTLVQSNIAEATIKSGLKGYSIVVDQNPDTVPDNIIETTSLEYEINQRFYQKFYVHVVAVDNVGNISEVAHYECTDTTDPTLVVTGNPTEWTKEDVVLTAKATDNESGIRGIKLPNGEWVYSDTATFVVATNGSYTFIAEDNFGNQTSVTVIVDKIDKTPPFNTTIIINNGALYTNNRDVVLTINAEDNATGVVAMRFRTENSPWSEWVPYATTFNYTMDAGFTHQGTNRVYVQFRDGVGNVGGDAFDSIIFDNIAPTGEIIYPKNTTNTRSITLTINAYDINPASADAISGLNSVRFRELQDGVVKQDWTSWEQHNFTRNWILSDGDGVKVIEMEIRDNAGNIGKVSKSIVLDTLFIKEALFTDIVNPPLGNPELPTSEVVKVKKGYEFTFIVKTTGEPDYATYTFNGETGYMIKLADNLFTKTLKVDINDDSVDNELLPINITVARNDGTQKTTTLKVHVEGSAYDDYNINLTN